MISLEHSFSASSPYAASFLAALTITINAWILWRPASASLTSTMSVRGRRGAWYSCVEQSTFPCTVHKGSASKIRPPLSANIGTLFLIFKMTMFGTLLQTESIINGEHACCLCPMPTTKTAADTPTGFEQTRRHKYKLCVCTAQAGNSRYDERDDGDERLNEERGVPVKDRSRTAEMQRRIE